MEQTVAFSGLMELIRVVGLFCTSPIFFGLSVINILVISFVFNMVIGILLGGISPRASKPPVVYPATDRMNNEAVDRLNTAISNFNPSPYDRMR